MYRLCKVKISRNISSTRGYELPEISRAHKGCCCCCWDHQCFLIMLTLPVEEKLPSDGTESASKTI